VGPGEGRSNRTNAGLAAVIAGIRHPQPVRAAYPGYRGQVKDGSADWRAEKRARQFCLPSHLEHLNHFDLCRAVVEILRQRETHHIRAAWEMIDGRTLKDIGISRNEIESDARHWS
jgi:uncharacterized protein YjiS (DUF1127 family)